VRAYGFDQRTAWIALGQRCRFRSRPYTYGYFGSIAWAEEHLGSSGGSRLMYKLVGIVFIFIGFLLITGQFTGFLGATLGRIFFRS
jgi:hypothetical protein